MVNVDLTITLGTMIQTGILVIGGVAALVTMRNTVASLKIEADATKEDTKERFEAIHDELKKMGDILIGMARFDERINNLDKRVTSQGRQIDELRHGEGFIRGHRISVDGEYEK